MTNATVAWRLALSRLFIEGTTVSPRGQQTLEMPHRTDRVNMRQCVVTQPERKLSYRFMAAEAYWILRGDNSLEELSAYNKRMAEFSDDGLVLAGAYGPPINAQLDYVVGRLLLDNDTRQAALTIWKPNPAPSKDVPCTVAMVFMLRNSLLNAHVFMRSSDLWLGWPYDVFSFSMVAHKICCRLNAQRNLDGQSILPVIEPGSLYLTAASSHLYDPQWVDARRCLGMTTHEEKPPSLHFRQPHTPPELFTSEATLLETLRELRESSPGHTKRWWESGDARPLDKPSAGLEAA